MFYAHHSIEIDLEYSVAYVDVELRCKSDEDFNDSSSWETPDTSTIKIDLVDHKFSHLMAEIEKQILSDSKKDKINWKKL